MNDKERARKKDLSDLTTPDPKRNKLDPNISSLPQEQTPKNPMNEAIKQMFWKEAGNTASRLSQNLNDNTAKSAQSTNNMMNENQNKEMIPPNKSTDTLRPQATRLKTKPATNTVSRPDYVRLQHQFKEMEAKFNKMSAEREILKKEVNTIKSDRDKAQKEANKLRTKSKNQHKKISDYQQRLNGHNRLKNEHNEIKKNYEDDKKRWNASNEQMAELANYKEKNAENMELIGTLTDTKNAKEAELKRLRSRWNELKQNYDTMDIELKLQKAENAQNARIATNPDQPLNAAMDKKEDNDGNSIEEKAMDIVKDSDDASENNENEVGNGGNAKKVHLFEESGNNNDDTIKLKAISLEIPIDEIPFILEPTHTTYTNKGTINVPTWIGKGQSLLKLGHSVAGGRLIDDLTASKAMRTVNGPKGKGTIGIYWGCSPGSKSQALDVTDIHGQVIGARPDDIASDFKTALQFQRIHTNNYEILKFLVPGNQKYLGHCNLRETFGHSTVYAINVEGLELCGKRIGQEECWINSMGTTEAIHGLVHLDLINIYRANKDVTLSDTVKETSLILVSFNDGICPVKEKKKKLENLKKINDLIMDNEQNEIEQEPKQQPSAFAKFVEDQEKQKKAADEAYYNNKRGKGKGKRGNWGKKPRNKGYYGRR